MVFAALVAGLASCVKESNPRLDGGRYPASGTEISVNPVLADGGWVPMSKAASDLAAKEVDDGYLKSHGFGLYAFYTGVDPFETIHDVDGVVFNKRKFIWDGGASSWVNYQWNGSNYDNAGKAEFWPTKANEKLTFFAFAPWDAWYNKVTTSAEKTCPYIVYDDYVAADLSAAELEAQEDILWGTNTYGMAHKDVGMSDYTPEGQVDMHFRHAPAKISFAVRGSLSGERPSQLNSGDAPTVSPLGSEVADNPDPLMTVETIRYVVYTGYRYYCVERETTTWTQNQTKTEPVRQSRTNVSFSHQGSRYLINSVNLNGFKRAGALLLDNASAFEPSWTDVNGTLNYTLNSENVLTQSLQNPGAATITSNISVYTGISESPIDLMGGYYLYAIPLSANSVSVSLNYSHYTIEAYTLASQHRDINRTATRANVRTFIREKYSYRSSTKYTKDSSNWSWDDGWDYESGQDIARRNGWTVQTGSDYDGGYTQATLGYSPNSTGYNEGSYTAWQYPDDPYITDSETPDPDNATTVSFNSRKELEGKVVTAFQGGRAYTINLIVSGKRLELDVVPRPWVLEESNLDYTSDINVVIQGLTYDSSYIDYADQAGNVYINNRMGKFYFKLGEGKYKTWQASLVGDAAFGFTDENGNWLYESDGVTKVNSVRAAVNKEVMNFLYIKALDSSSTVTSRAKLRIYGIDSNGEATALLNLVDMDGVVEWTIVQNAN